MPVFPGKIVMNIIDRILAWLPAGGYKTYVLGLATIGMGVWQYYTGDSVAATTALLAGLGLIFGRAGAAQDAAQAQANGAAGISPQQFPRV